MTRWFGGAFVLAVLGSGVVCAQLDVDRFAALRARCIGPAGMSGRIAAIDALDADPETIVVGAATGGLWKTTSGGTSWTPLFDREPVSSIGAVKIDPTNPSVIWVGTGEGNPRNSSGVGYGVFKSVDGGATWRHLGLERTEKIHRIVLDPRDPDVAWVAALGTTWGENPERGVYKTTDGGATWRKVLYVDPRTGCADLVQDPTNPDKLIAATWDHRRHPWSFRSGGPGSAIWLSHDGGESWTRLGADAGLPEGPLGRIGLAIAAGRPDVVYALVECERDALCRSDDGGRTFRVVNRSSNVNPRPFYFADLRVDPTNENRVYRLQMLLDRSEDGGRTFETLLPFARVHPDHHALWISSDGKRLIDGNDGGIAISTDRGRHWRFSETLPLAQFYHVRVDMDVPYHVYGGLQDNGSWRGPAALWENGGIRNYHWQEVGFGDGFDTLPDPENSRRGYAMSQGGHLIRWDLRTGERKSIRPIHPDRVRLRFAWNAALAIDPFDPATIYYGSQFVHRSRDRGESWTIASPDLTTDDPAKQKQADSGGLTPDVTDAENHTTLLAIAPSPKRRGVVWAGSDDGRVHVTRDDCATWVDVTAAIPDLPPGTWCPHIAPSKFDAAGAFVVFDDHRRANWTTYVYRTDDFGASWTKLTANDPTGPDAPWGFAHVIEQDPVDPDLLFLGTEFGLWVSVDGGVHWAKWTHGVPTCPVRDLVVHPREHDLVIGTHGRAAFVLDDVAPLRFRGASRAPLAIARIRPAVRYRPRQVDGYRFVGDGMFRGRNAPYGALVTVELASRPDDEDAKLAVDVLDASGRVVRTFERPIRSTVVRFTWNLRADGYRVPSRAKSPRRRSGVPAPPGHYTIRVSHGAHRAEAAFELRADPRVPFDADALAAKRALEADVGHRLEVAAELVARVQAMRTRLDAFDVLLAEREESTTDATFRAGLRERLVAVRKAADAAVDRVLPPAGRKGIPASTDTASECLGRVFRSLRSSDGRPTAAERRALVVADAALDTALDAYAAYVDACRAFDAQASLLGGWTTLAAKPLDRTWRPTKRTGEETPTRDLGAR